MKSWKRVSTVLLSGIMVFNNLPGTVFAEEVAAETPVLLTEESATELAEEASWTEAIAETEQITAETEQAAAEEMQEEETTEITEEASEKEEITEAETSEMISDEGEVIGEEELVIGSGEEIAELPEETEPMTLEQDAADIVPADVIELSLGGSWTVSEDEEGQMWFRYTAQEDGKYSFSSVDDGTDLSIYCFEAMDMGTEYMQLQMVELEDVSNGCTYILSTEMKKGETYYYKVNLYQWSPAHKFMFDRTKPSGSGLPADARELILDDTWTVGENAAQEMWFRYTAQEDAAYSFISASDGSDVHVRCYRAVNLGAENAYAEFVDAENGSLLAEMKKGETYFYRVFLYSYEPEHEFSFIKKRIIQSFDVAARKNIRAKYTLTEKDITAIDGNSVAYRINFGNLDGTVTYTDGSSCSVIPYGIDMSGETEYYISMTERMPDGTYDVENSESISDDGAGVICWLWNPKKEMRFKIEMALYDVEGIEKLYAAEPVEVSIVMDGGDHVHIWQKEYTVDRAATCLVEGSKSIHCKKCKAVKARKKIAKLTPTLKLSAASVPVKVKQTVSLTKLVGGMAKGDRIASWSIKDPKIASISKSGTVKGLKAGKSTTVTVTLASGKKGTIKINVQKKAVKTAKIAGLPRKLTLAKGKKQTLRPVVTPISSTQKLTYSSNNKTVAAVSSKGVITAKKAGSARITVKSGSKKYVVTVTVPKIKTTAISKVPGKINIKKGKTYRLNPVCAPKNTDEKLIYTTSNKKIATVDKNGKIKARKKGTVNITVKSGKVKVVCKVTIK